MNVFNENGAGGAPTQTYTKKGLSPSISHSHLCRDSAIGLAASTFGMCLSAYMLCAMYLSCCGEN